MEKILKKMPGAEDMTPKASVVLEINLNHPIADKLISLYGSDAEGLKDYAKTLYYQACLTGGVSIDNPKEFNALITKLMI
jgi:HSP90 family molecular chaperone